MRKVTRFVLSDVRIQHITPGIRSNLSEHGSKMKICFPPSEHGCLRRAAVAVDAAAVGVG